MVMASCSSESVFEEGPAGAQQTPESKKGDMYMSMNIAPTGAVGTRTETGNQGSEIGQDRENKISTALVIFADKIGDDYKVITSTYSGTTGTDFQLTGTPQSDYMATFKVDRQTLLNNIGAQDSKDYYIFIVANAPSDLAAKFVVPTSGTAPSVQQIFATTGDQNTYWTVDNFLMSNSEVNALTVEKEAIKVGTHTTPTDPFDLGRVKVQRAMSRFDLAVGPAYTKFTASAEGRPELEAGNSDLQDVTIEFDAVALINMAQEANSFKVTGVDKSINFAAETKNNWVYSPVQNNFSTPLFAGSVNNGILTGTTVVSGLEGFFQTEAYETSTGITPDPNVPAAVYRVGGFTKITNITEADNAYNRPTDAASNQPDYSIWRYCMENTNPCKVDHATTPVENHDADNQKNGNSTGVVFRAKITGKKVDGTPIDGSMGALYAYNNVIIGNAATLRTYATTPKAETDNSGVYDAVKLKYVDAVGKYNEAATTTPKFTFNPEGEDGYTKISEATPEQLQNLKSYLVENGFSVYNPTENSAEGVYYCYYIYWNRHNDNGKNAEMGPMEFATVRNNVYKLRVSKIHKLGHPGKPEDDPDDPDPDDPDEKDSFYCQVICEILPWEVRINDIEF